MPDKRGIKPGYEQKRFTDEDKRGKLRLVASRDGREGSVTIHTDATLYAGLFGTGEHAELALAPGRHAWIHVARGSVRVNGQLLSTGDGLAISDETTVVVDGVDDGELLVFDLA
jgi:hypothetical protein